MNVPNTQLITILAQDPAVRIGGRLVVTQVPVPAEILGDGPTGYRVKVVDYDATSDRLYLGHRYQTGPSGHVVDPFAPPKSSKAWPAYEERLLGDPRFHAQNAYAITMRTLARFEFALGRRVQWGFDGHQLHIAPHAFCEANAFYSEADRALMFGYFTGKSGKPVFTSLSHDIIAHETTHALLDGIRDSYTEPSTPDQAAFHEGFSDVVALLSIFSLPSVVDACLALKQTRGTGGRNLIAKGRVTAPALRESLLFGIGKQFGRELAEMRGDPLRQSVLLKPRTDYLDKPEWQEEHRRGEVFVAAVMNAVIELWAKRIAALGTFKGKYVNRDLVVEEGAKVADQLLTAVIRALDYCPPIDIEFGDFLASLLTVDAEVAPDDRRFEYRRIIRKSFADYGIVVPARDTDATTGEWLRFARQHDVIYSRANFESMLHDCDEVFRFLWDNRVLFGIDERGYTRVKFVRPSTRIGPDGFILRETVCEYTQVMQLFGAEFQAILGFDRPDGMPTTQRVTAMGGGTVIFDQYGRVKYHIARPLGDAARQQRHMEYLWRMGVLERPVDARNHFAMMHWRRELGRRY